MDTHQPLKKDELAERFTVDPSCPSGLRYSNSELVPKRFRGKPAGCQGVNKQKPTTYRFYRVQVRRKTMISHRVVYLLHYGEDPLDRDVDHIDRNPLNNHPSNLRLATRSQNSQNAKKYITNTTGRRGVCWNKKLSKWQAYIGFKKRLHHLGLFDSLDDASKARNEAEIKMHAEFSAMLSKAKP